MGELVASHRTPEVCSYNQEEGFVKYISVPTLGSIAAVAIAVELWRHSELTDELEQHASEFSPGCGFIYSEKVRSFDGMVEKVTDRTSLLPLPHLLRRVVSNIVRPIGFEILKFIDTQPEEYFERNYLEPVNSICWTMEGIIDKVKSFELQISAQKLKNNYRIACKYCLENHITNLWDQMSKEMQERFFLNKYYPDLQKYWICFCRNEVHRFFSIIDRRLSDSNCSIYEHVFKSSLKDGNVLAVKYFWNKLTWIEISNNLRQWIDLAIERSRMYRNQDFPQSSEYTDILCFLLHRLDCEQQQREVFQKHPGILKILFLNWPWQKFLLPTMRAMLPYLQIKDYNGVMFQIKQEIKEGNTADNLFKELWCVSPPILKNCFNHYSARLSDIVLGGYLQ